MTFDIEDILRIIVIVAPAVAAIFIERYKMKEYIRDQNEDIRKEITDLKVEQQKLKSKDELQQQVIDQIGKQMDFLIQKSDDVLNPKTRMK